MITPAQCRAARAFLEMSQKQLAEEAEVSLRSVQGFEAGNRILQRLALLALERVFDRRGILLISEDGWCGVKISTVHR